MNAQRATHQPTPDLAAEARAHASAVRVVAGRATDAHDCVELLAMLGLDADLARPLPLARRR
jgi:hypothetical protein